MSEELNESLTPENEDFVVKAKGFSYDTSATDLAQFFAGCDIKDGKTKGIHFLINKAGKSNEAYVEFYENDDLKKALTYNKKYLGDRYVDVSKASRELMEEALNFNETIDDVDTSTIVKLYGMPYTALHEDVSVFLAGCDIEGGKKKGIYFLRNSDGSASGACFVELLTSDDVKLALSKDKQYMGNRFCHVIKIPIEERDEIVAKQTEELEDLKEPIVMLKGLPFKTSEQDIKNFFPDLDIIAVEMVLNDQGNCKGEAFLDFGSLDDAREAMKSYKLKLLHRFIDVTKSDRAEWVKLLPQTDKVAKTADDIEEPILKLSNLPLKVTKDEIEDFLFGIECRAVQIVRLPRGDCNGECFVEFTSLEDTAKAVAKHKQPLNAESDRERLVELSLSSRCEWRKDPLSKTAKTAIQSPTPARKSTTSRKRPLNLDHSSSSESRDNRPRINEPVGYPSSYTYYNSPQVGYGDRSAHREHLVNMVGLPFSATVEDVRQFFYPIKMTDVEFLKNDRGLPRGIAVVGFYSAADRDDAMKRNKNTIGSRYVNLHVRNEPRDFNYEFTKASGGSRRDSYDSRGSRDTYNSSYRDTRRSRY